MAQVVPRWNRPVMRYGAASAGMRVAKYLGKRAGSYLKNRSKRMRSSAVAGSRGLTDQRPQSNIYVNRRPNRRRARRAKRFTGSVKRVIADNLGARHQLVRAVQTATSASTSRNDCVAVIAFSQYFYGGAATAANDALKIIFDNEFPGSTSSDRTGRIMFKNCVYDYGVLNKSTTDIVYVDIYFWVARKDSFGVGITTQYANALDIQAPITGGQEVNSINMWGASPFMAPLFCKLNKILKVKRIALQPGEFYNFQQKNSANFTIDHGTTDRISAFKGKTMGVLMLCRSGTLTGVTPYPVACNVEVSMLGRYQYSIDADSSNTTKYND